MPNLQWTTDGLGVRMLRLPGCPHPVTLVPAAYSHSGRLEIWWPDWKAREWRQLYAELPGHRQWIRGTLGGALRRLGVPALPRALGRTG